MLEVWVGGQPVVCLLANAYRADLRLAGMGSGCHGFDMVLQDGFTGAIEVRRAGDGAILALTESAQRISERAAASRPRSPPAAPAIPAMPGRAGGGRVCDAAGAVEQHPAGGDDAGRAGGGVHPRAGVIAGHKHQRGCTLRAMTAVHLQPMTLQQFLAWEELQERRYEFDGFGPVAMAGGTAEHDRITINLAASLVTRLRGTPGRPCGANLKVEVMGRIRYPDGYVTCSPLIPGSTVITDPVVIFEVLSKGTASADRVTKNREYRGTASVTHYVMLEQTEAAATVLERQGERWISTLLGAAAVLMLPSIGIEIPMVELYEGLEFAATQPPPGHP